MYSPYARAHLAHTLKASLQSPAADAAGTWLALALDTQTWRLARPMYLVERGGSPAVHAEALRRVARRSAAEGPARTLGVGADESLREEAVEFYRLLVEYHEAASPSAGILARVMASRPGTTRPRGPGCHLRGLRGPRSPLSRVTTAEDPEDMSQDQSHGGRRGTKRRALPDGRPSGPDPFDAGRWRWMRLEGKMRKRMERSECNLGRIDEEKEEEEGEGRARQ